MFRFPDPHPATRARIRRDEGFSLLEVVVALGIFALVSVIIGTEVIAAIRATNVARDVTQAKGVAQARLEQIRSMPFFVGRAAGDYIDVLDTYYRDTSAPTGTVNCGATTPATLPPLNWTGYVPSTGTHCSWEPAGPLYRKVINPISAPGLGAFAMVVSTQFLTANTPPAPIPAPVGYNTQVAGKDSAPTTQIGVTIAVFYRSTSGTRMVSTYTQVERSNAIDPLIESKARTTTVAVSSTSATGETLTSQVGVVDLLGELFTGSRVVSTATAGHASDSSGVSVRGATRNLVAPADITGQSVTEVEKKREGNECAWFCFGTTKVDQASAVASSGLPKAGTPTTPIRAYIPDNTTRAGFQFSNDAAGNRLRLLATQPMVSADTTLTSPSLTGVKNCTFTDPAATPLASYLLATGYLDATASPTPQVASCATAQSAWIRLFPTDYAPGGVIRIYLDRAAAACTVDRSTGTPALTSSGTYTGRLLYWNGSGYTTLNLGTGNGTDPLDTIPLTTPVAAGLTLGDYVSSWNSLTSAGVVLTNTANKAEVDLPGAITILTKPTREGVPGGVGPYAADEDAAISLAVGALSCKAGDYR